MKPDIHTNAILANAVDTNGNRRQLALLFRQDDSWYSDSGTSRQDELYAAFLRLMRGDKNIIGFQGDIYSLENGLYKKSNTFLPVLAK